MGFCQVFSMKVFNSVIGMGEGEDGKESSVLTFLKHSIFKSL